MKTIHMFQRWGNVVCTCLFLGSFLCVYSSNYGNSLIISSPYTKDGVSLFCPQLMLWKKLALIIISLAYCSLSWLIEKEKKHCASTHGLVSACLFLTIIIAPCVDTSEFSLTQINRMTITSAESVLCAIAFGMLLIAREVKLKRIKVFTILLLVTAIVFLYPICELQYSFLSHSLLHSHQVRVKVSVYLIALALFMSSHSLIGTIEDGKVFSISEQGTIEKHVHLLGILILVIFFLAMVKLICRVLDNPIGNPDNSWMEMLSAMVLVFGIIRIAFSVRKTTINLYLDILPFFFLVVLWGVVQRVSPIVQNGGATNDWRMTKSVFTLFYPGLASTIYALFFIDKKRLFERNVCFFSVVIIIVLLAFLPVLKIGAIGNLIMGAFPPIILLLCGTGDGSLPHDKNNN